MSRRRRGRSGAKPGPIVLVVLLGVLLVSLVGGLTWLFLKGRAQYVPRDQASLCPLTGPESQTLVLIDTTDALADVTQTQVLGKLRDLVASVPKNGLLEIRAMDADPGKSIAVMTPICNPGDGKDIDPLTGNPEKAMALWKEQYLAKVEDVLASTIHGSPQDFSPILEVLQRIAAEHLTTSRDRSIPSKLVVVSDMIQHTPAYSHYVDGLSLETYRAKAGKRLATDLAGASVELWMVQRATQKVNPEELGNFWLEWVTASNAHAPVTLSPLMGM